MASTTDVVLAGELRERIADQGGRWAPDPALSDTTPLPARTTGGRPPTIRAADVPRVDFDRLRGAMAAGDLRIARPPAVPLSPLPGLDPASLPRVVEGTLIRPPLAPSSAPPLPAPAAPGHPKPASPQPSTIYDAVDWRDRWGSSWFTKVRDQGGCGVCWAFASTGLVEAMLRVEHCVWAPRSEGDTLLSAHANCDNGGDIPLGLDAIVANGLVDANDMPFQESVANYVAAPDRPGRIARIAGYTPVGHFDDQKRWLLDVGPLATGFYVWADFMYGYGHGALVYHVDRTQIGYVDARHPGDEKGWHALVVVGFNDALGAWIVRNSWGPAWGYGGYAYIGYGETEIDTYAKYGVVGTDCDPWAKRKQRSGCLIEGDQGPRHDELELVASHGAQLRHWRRVNGTWQPLVDFANDVPSAIPAVIQSTFTRNHELVHRAGSDGLLHHWWRGSASQVWRDGGSFGPADVAGVPGLIQSTYAEPGNLEVVTRTVDGRLVHVARSGGQWLEVTRFASSVLHSGSTLVQSSFGTAGDFEVVCVLVDGTMQHWHRSNDAGRVWSLVATFGSGIDSPPVMIEGQSGALDETVPGNFELCVAVRGQFQHWWRDNTASRTWRTSGSFGTNVASVAGLCQSSAGFDLELIVVRRDLRLQHYWRDGAGWHPGPVVDSLSGS